MPPKKAGPAGAKAKAAVKHPLSSTNDTSRQRKSKQQNLLTFGFGRRPSPLEKEPECRRPEKRQRTPDMLEVEETQLPPFSPEVLSPLSSSDPAEPNSDSDEEDTPQLTAYFLGAKPKAMPPLPLTPRRREVIEIPDSSSPRTLRIRRGSPPASNRPLSPSPKCRRSPQPANCVNPGHAASRLDLMQPAFTIRPSTIPSSQWWENEDTQENISTQPSLQHKVQSQDGLQESGLEQEEMEGLQKLSVCGSQHSIYERFASQNMSEMRAKSDLSNSADLEDNPTAHESQSAISLMNVVPGCIEGGEFGHLPPEQEDEIQSESESTAERSQDPDCQFRPVKTQVLPNSFLRNRTSDSSLSEGSWSLPSPFDKPTANPMSDSHHEQTRGLNGEVYATDDRQAQSLNDAVSSLHGGAQEGGITNRRLIGGEWSGNLPGRNVPMTITESQLLPNTLMESFPLPPPMTQYTQPPSSFPDPEETQ